MTISKRPASRAVQAAPPVPVPPEARRAKKSIYQHQAPEVAAVFAAAARPDKVAIVAIDYAKKEHRAMIVNGSGDVLRQPFTVSNNAEGVAFLLEAVRTTLKRNALRPAQVIYGGEDEPAYVSNFLAALAVKKALVVRVNALEAKKQRDQFTASTDDLDLLGIAKCILTRRVTMASPGRLSDEESRRVLALRELVRGRRRMVFSLTAVKNQIHALTDRLFPGFMDEKKSGVIAFSEASLQLLESSFSAPAVGRAPGVAGQQCPASAQHAGGDRQPDSLHGRRTLPSAGGVFHHAARRGCRAGLRAGGGTRSAPAHRLLFPPVRLCRHCAAHFPDRRPRPARHAKRGAAPL